MDVFKVLDALACPLPLSGIDTDQLIPARFMKRSRADGYGDFLLYDLRFDENGQFVNPPKPEEIMVDYEEELGSHFVPIQINYKWVFYKLQIFISKD